MEVLLSGADIDGALAELYSYVDRSFPDAELDAFVDSLASRIATFDKWAIATIKRLVNLASLPSDSWTRACRPRLTLNNDWVTSSAPWEPELPIAFAGERRYGARDIDAVPAWPAPGFSTMFSRNDCHTFGSETATAS
jgi:hypothetical protein